ncbi:YceI family protein [Pseudoteredinibacter isoporae]|uniref:Polyisoprenoid-binding protein YceI n=1 Tax=Pseudoteredinibacter isoporae TaxID=570281 RepID=A0A7X0JWA6_9GAMM|nr:YceI family protein [Pseudoteredinibacter isoporae]MBB6523415.1 polyisoprenoid-binding protein YceI [Pseudoteredinibacter isoporae]NHO88926.1 YceI family protein [Pseudoteredinibacter isoporae]NIB24366.1 YceI family protein [Pseudoteredinibacter isoporae]
MIVKNLIKFTAIAATALASIQATAADYQVDIKGAHAFINFKIKHLGYSWLTGRFNTFDGQFSWDEKNPNASQINIEIDTNSIDSNHAERDKHLRGEDFLNVKKFPKASFVSEKIEFSSPTEGTVTGTLTLHGVSKTISFPVEKLGEGKDPWGGYRAGFAGATTLKLADYGMTYNLGPASTHVELELLVEGIRK